MKNNGRNSLQIGLLREYATPIAQNKEKILVQMLNVSLDRDFIGFRHISIYGLMKRTVRVESDK